MTPQEFENAKKLVIGSQVFATNSRDGFAAQYPTVSQLSSDDWNSLLGIAGTGTALLMIPSRYTQPEQKELTATVVATLLEWDENAVQNLADFLNFVTAEAKDPTQIPDVIGAWILRTITLREADNSATRVLGLMLMNTFGPWWDQ